MSPRLDPVVQIRRRAVVQLRQHHIAQRHLDLPAAARDDLGQQAKRRGQPGGVVGRRVAGQRRRAVGIAGHRRDAGRRLDDVVERRIVAAVHPETGQRDADDLLVVLPQRLVGEPEPADRRRLHIDQQRMRIRDEFAEPLLARLRPQVETDALLVAVQAGEVAVADLAGDLAARRLDLDDLGAEVGQQHRGVRACEHDADLEDADARQRARCAFGHRTRLGELAQSPRACGISRRSVRRGCRRSAAAAPTGR